MFSVSHSTEKLEVSMNYPAESPTFTHTVNYTEIHLYIPPDTNKIFILLLFFHNFAKTTKLI